MAKAGTGKPPGYTGAYAEETAESRIGLASGIYGAQNVTRTWRVYTALPTDNPIWTIGRLSSAYGGETVGTPFPTDGEWGDGSYVLLFFTILDHWTGTNVWTIQGHYGPSYLTTFQSQAWNFSLRGTLETERVFTALPTRDENNIEHPGKAIGAPRYEAIPGPTGSFGASAPDGKQVALRLASGTDPTLWSLPRYATGADRPKRLSNLTLWKTIPGWNFAAVSAAMNAQRLLNSDTFSTLTTSGRVTWVDLSANGLRKMMFTDIAVDPVPTDQSGLPQRDPGPAFRVTLNFKFNPDGWDYVLRHMHKFEDGGYEAPIFLQGATDPIDETFILQGDTSLSGIVDAFV